MVVCPSCGQENPEGFRLCGMCGAALAVAAAPTREERKVVTIVFTDLVGSTARAEGLDPEDVRATLSKYYAQLRAELGRHGVTVEKFSGGEAMAVFGAPVAHASAATSSRTGERRSWDASASEICSPTHSRARAESTRPSS